MILYSMERSGKSGRYLHIKSLKSHLINHKILPGNSSVDADEVHPLSLKFFDGECSSSSNASFESLETSINHRAQVLLRYLWDHKLRPTTLYRFRESIEQVISTEDVPQADAVAH